MLQPYAEAAGLTGLGPFSLGRPDDYRVPDHGYHQGRPMGTWVPTAAMVVEIVSPDDETYEKFPFYAEREVEEILVVDPAARTVAIWQRTAEAAYQATSASALHGVTVAQLAAEISWPEAAD